MRQSKYTSSPCRMWSGLSDDPSCSLTLGASVGKRGRGERAGKNGSEGVRDGEEGGNGGWEMVIERRGERDGEREVRGNG